MVAILVYKFNQNSWTYAKGRKRTSKLGEGFSYERSIIERSFGSFDGGPKGSAIHEKPIAVYGGWPI